LLLMAIPVVVANYAVVEVGEARTLDLVKFFELIADGLEFELRKVLVEVLGNVPAGVADNGVPGVPVVVLGVGQLGEDQLLL
jgi:hypothetical protein